YSSKDKKPFEDLSLIMDTEKVVNNYLNQPENKGFSDIVTKAKNFLSGYYSPFGLELLSTIDFIKRERHKENAEEILIELKSWSDRKRTLFANHKFVNIALENINRQFA